MRLIPAVVAGLLLASSASAQQGDGGPAPPVLLLRADSLDHDRDADILTASGNVEVVHGERTLRARRLVYDRANGIVAAEGSVVLLEPGGEAIFADRAELSSDLKSGVVDAIRMRMSDDSRLAANAARRMGEGRDEFSKAVFSRCEPCRDNPRRAPLWQVKAREAVHDREARQLVYRDAHLEMWGVPLLYTPYLSHPDATVRRKSGFLPADYGNHSDLGPFVEAAYFWNIAPNEDLTVSPTYTGRHGLITRVEYRRLFGFGRLEADGSAARIDRDTPEKATADDLRGHINVTGEFHIDPVWRARAEIRQTSDDTYLRRAGIDTAPTLTSGGEVEGFHDEGYSRLSVSGVRDLRAGLSDEATPFAVPEGVHEWRSAPGPDGIRWLRVGGAALHRQRGVRSRRGTVEVGWDRALTTAGGHRFDVSASLRGDLRGHEDGGEDGSHAGVVPRAAAGWRYPAVRAAGGADLIVEPRAQLVLGPDRGIPEDAPNEDSRTIEFDHANLFDPDRFPGSDRIETGRRLDYGLAAGLLWPDGRRLEGSIGQSLRRGGNGRFPVGSGTGASASDIVGRVEASPIRDTDLLYRFRFDRRTLTARRSEVGLKAGPPWLRLGLDYVFVVDTDRDDRLFEDREQISMRLDSRLSRHWWAYADHRRGLAGDSAGPLMNGVGITYDDECFRFEGAYERNYVRDRDIVSSEAVVFRMVFKQLGELRQRRSLGGG